MSDIDGADRPLASRGPERSGAPTLADVARRAGVSTATASRALSPRASSAPSTPARDRVLAAADELGYVVNGLARSMMGRGRRSVAFVSREMVGPTFAALAAGAEEAVTAHGFFFTLSTTHGDVDREREIVDTLREQRAAAVLLVGSTSTGDAFAERMRSYTDALDRVGARLILCGRPSLPTVPAAISLDYDHSGGVRRAVEHLAARGHRRIAYLGFERDTTTPQQRRRGYLDGLRAAGLAHDPTLEFLVENSVASAHDVVGAIDLRAITAFVCSTDVIAVGAMSALRERGVSVPHDASVVGFDDMDLVDQLTPALTTVRAPFRELGTLAGRIAIGEVAGEDAVLPTELVVRASTADARTTLTPRG